MKGPCDSKRFHAIGRRAFKWGAISLVVLSATLPVLSLAQTADQTAVETSTQTPDPAGDIVTDEDFAAALPGLEPPESSDSPEIDVSETDAPDPLATSAEPPPPPADPIADNTVVVTELPTEDPGGLPAVTVQDAELATPLPPLDGYDVRPLQASAVPDRELPEIRYVLRTEGLWGRMKDQFKDLSALEEADGRAANTAMIRARANEDEALVLRLMKSEGYFDGSVITAVAPEPGRNDTTRVVMTATPGDLYRFRDVDIEADTTVPPDLLQRSLPLVKGDPIVADTVLAAEAKVTVELQQNGYPFVKTGPRDILLDPADHTGDYRLTVDTGPRSRFGGFRSDGEIVFQPDHVAILTRFDRGDLYDNRRVDDLREALVATGLFRSVGVEPTLSGETAPDGSAYVDLLVHQQKGPSRKLAAEVGYSTGEGFQAAVSWQDRNRFPPEGAMIFAAVLGTQEQSLAATLRRSNHGQRDRSTQLSAIAAHNVYDAYDANTATLSFSRSRVSTPLWQKRWTWSWGVDVLATQEIFTDLDTRNSNVREVFFLADVPIRIGYDRSNDLLNPTQGFRLGVQTVPEVNLGESGAPNIKTLFDASYYRSLNDRTVIATRGRIGTLLGAELDNIAPSRRLYAGGGGSVRGFAYQGLAPLDINGDPIGGRSLFEASLEVRYRLGDLGIVPFIDVGQAFDAEIPDFSDLRFGVGVGARLYTNFGPVRIDVAIPINRRDIDPQVALYVGIGQAF